jgi:nitrate reductase gamma subunit
MRVLYALVAVSGVAAAGWAAGHTWPELAIVVPGLAAAIFLVGIPVQVWRWARTPVPFRITTTCGQQRSLPWIKAASLESPSTAIGVMARMALEVLLFRSLFRHTTSQLRSGPRIVYREQKWLWLGAIAFHWALLVIVLRHLRFFIEPTPLLARAAAAVDGFFQVGTPVVYVTDLVVLAALAYLLLRRVLDARLRYISLFSDYVALFLLLGITSTGIWMRYVSRTDVVAAKQLALALVTFSPAGLASASALFLVHLTLVSALLAYLPFSKLVHMAGVFFSPTRNLPNDNRRRRHVNPWNHPVKVHTYDEWEDEFRDKIKAAGLPLERV